MLVRINAFARAFAILFSAGLMAGSSPATAKLLPLSPQQVARLGIRTAPVAPAVTKSVVSVLGRITPAPGARVPVSAPFAGTVKTLIRLEGEIVKQGDPLAVIASTEMYRLSGQEARYRSAKAAADRARLLVDEGIAPASRAEEANAQAAEAAGELSALRGSAARAARAGDGEYRLLAPASGRIAAINATIGESIAAQQPVFSLDTGSEIWVEGALPAGMIGKVKPGDSVSVDGTDATGTVVAVGSSINAKTRSATLRARLSASAHLVTGQTVRLSVSTPAGKGSFNVPRNAVSELKTGPAVFVARKNGFEAVPVRVLARGARDATIIGALGTRDAVAVTGVTELKAILGQE
jgi:cobalt-zinc-cadmium efflux system membrane fusion protein